MNGKRALAHAMATGRDAKVVRLTLHRVEFNSDGNEGRGATSYEYYLDAGTAATRAKHNFVMGTDCPVKAIEESVLVIGDNIFRIGDEVVLQYEDPREVRARALAKLTPEERKVLGIKG